MKNVVVAKFGGSSVKDAEAMLRCAVVIENNPQIQVVVISATQNTTNQLEFIAKASERGDETTLQSLIKEMVERHQKIANELFTSEEARTELAFLFEEIKFVSSEIVKTKNYTPAIMDQLYSLGERMSSLLVSDLMKLRLAGRPVELLDARTVIKTNSEFQKAEPQIELIREKAELLLFEKLNKNTLFVTQGFIGKDLLGNTTTLGREGSDYTAALFGEALNASLVQIWTDVAGIASSDPRLVPEARFIPTLSYDEATSLASLGAKVLFPTTLLPTKRKDIPVFVGSSLNPSLGGTMITKKQDENFKLKAVSLMTKGESAIISFIGCHLDQAIDLMSTIKKLFGDQSLDFVDMTAVSISFKVNQADGKSALVKAHEVLIKHF
jgi:aspartate kinase